MGSGCKSNPTWFQKKIADSGIEYTGVAIPALGICTHDTLSEIEAVVLGKIIDYSTGVGIHIPNIDLTACDLFKNYITCCNTCDELDCLMEIIFSSLCVLYTDYTELAAQVTALLQGPYNTACLTLGSNPTLVQIIQELIKEFCALKASFDTLQTSVNGITSSLSDNIGNFLLNAITTCQKSSGPIKSGSGRTASITFNGFTPIGGIIMYYKPLDVFDSTGLGVSPGPACGWAICNGNNNTPNMCGLVPVGSTDMGSTQPISGQIFPNNTNTGEYYHTLSVTETPLKSHTHGVDEHGGHSHVMSVSLDGASGNFSNFMKIDGSGFSTTLDGQADVGNIHAKIRNNVTGITINNAVDSASAKHNNIQPSHSVYFIMRIS